MVLQKVAGSHTRRKCHNIPLPDRNSAAPWTAQQNKSKISKYFGSRNPQIDRNVFPGCKRWMCIVHNFQVSKFIINLGVSIVYERCTTCPFTRKGHGWSKWSSAVWIVNHACVKLYLVLISGWPPIDCEGFDKHLNIQSPLPLSPSYSNFIYFFDLFCSANLSNIHVYFFVIICQQMSTGMIRHQALATKARQATCSWPSDRCSAWYTAGPQTWLVSDCISLIHEGP
jgi:hypothetical protein